MLANYFLCTDFFSTYDLCNQKQLKKNHSIVTSDGGSWSFFQDASEPFSLKEKKNKTQDKTQIRQFR